MISSTLIAALASTLLVGRIQALVVIIPLLETNTTNSALKYPPPAGDPGSLPGADYLERFGVRAWFGNPAQEIYLKPSLLSNDTIVRSPNACILRKIGPSVLDSYSTCETRTQGLFAVNESTTVSVGSNITVINPITPPNWPAEQYVWNDTWAEGILVTDEVHFFNASSGATQSQFPFIVDQKHFSFATLRSILGLGKTSSLLQATQNSKFSYTGRGQGKTPNPNYSLTLGDGLVKNKVGANFTSKILPNDNKPFRVTVTNMTIGNTVLQLSQNFTYAVDFSSSTISLLPPSIYYAIGNASNQTIVEPPSNNYPHGLLANNMTAVPEDIKDQWNLTITLDNGYKFDVLQSSIFANARNQNGSFYDTQALFSQSESSDTENAYILGGDFWLGSYFEVDYDKMEWMVAQAADPEFPLKYGDKKSSAMSMKQNWRVCVVSAFMAVVVLMAV